MCLTNKFHILPKSFHSPKLGKLFFHAQTMAQFSTKKQSIADVELALQEEREEKKSGRERDLSIRRLECITS